MRVLVVNAGSSSVKLRVLGSDDTVLSERDHERWDGDAGPIAEFVAEVGVVDAVGHRVVHGGSDLTAATRIDESVVAQIEALTSLAPLHQSRAVAGILAARAALPDVPAVACFDTAFHASMSDVAATYALPEEWRRRWGLRRFGFHGLSHQYAARRARELLGRDDLRVVSCHLGAGASLCASQAGRSVDTTMGFTPLEGLVMATRSGSVDPGLLLWLLTEATLSPPDLADALEHRSGLAGLSGGSGDMRDVLARREAGEPSARLAFDVYVHRLVKDIASMVASLGGLDALVFTGGVGEHAVEVRTAAVDRLDFLDIAPESGTGVPVLVVESREDLEISRQTRRLLQTRPVTASQVEEDEQRRDAPEPEPEAEQHE